MDLRSVFAVAALSLVLLGGCLGSGSDDEGTSTPPDTNPSSNDFTFTTTLVDDQYGTGEPSILADPAGTLWIVGPTGFVTPLVTRDPIPYTHDSGVFKSTDGGKTWNWVEQIPMYGRDTCPGGGDSDIAAAPDGALFLIDLNLENVPIDVSMDGGNTWLFNCNSSIVPGLDRQWVAASNDYVWISVNHLALGPIVYRAPRLGLPLDGLVFGPPVQVDQGGAIVVDQADGTLYLAGSGGTVEVSTDNGDTWTSHDTGLQGHSLGGSFISIALDAQGNVYVAGSGSEGVVVSASSDHGETWTNATVFHPYEGDYGFAWVAAGGDGIVDVGWYGRPDENATGAFAMEEHGFYLFAAQSHDILEKGANATSITTLVDPEPVTTKNLCTGINLVGLVPCDQADPSATRALGDFFETGVDNDGNMIIAYVSEYNHDPPVLKFAKQTGGLLAPPT